MADAISYPGEDKKKVSDRLRWYLRQGYLTPVARETEGKKSWLFYPSEVLVAEVLARLHEFGVTEAGAANAVAQALNGWRDTDFDGDTPPAPNPGMHVIKQYEAGAPDWSLVLWLFANPSTGAKMFQGIIAASERREGTSLITSNPGYAARSVFAVDLIDVLSRVHPSARAAREAQH